MRGTQPIYLGVDVAGASNTWAAALEPTTGGARIVWGPTQATLAEIVGYAEREAVIAVAIDAQLTLAVSDETGFRSGDLELRRMLPADCCNRVQSINSMMAVPVRGQLLAETLGSVVGTIIETHPRASLHFALGADVDEAIRAYKPAPAPREAVQALWNGWVSRFCIEGPAPPASDGPVDALVCATVALLYHRDPSALYRLTHAAADRRGRGPFYVVTPPDYRRQSAVMSSERTPAGLPIVPESAERDLSAAADLVEIRKPTVHRDIVGRAVMCPACGEHRFASWPYGWDSHAAHKCRGLVSTSPAERKAEFRERFPRLFR